MPTAYKRVLLKLSGEALMGDDAFGINRATIERMVADVAEVVRIGTQLAALAKIPHDAKLERSEIHSDAKVDCYKITLANVDGKRVHGWLSVPKGKGPFPAILTRLEVKRDPAVVQADRWLRTHRWSSDQGRGRLEGGDRDGCDAEEPQRAARGGGDGWGEASAGHRRLSSR